MSDNDSNDVINNTTAASRGSSANNDINYKL